MLKAADIKEGMELPGLTMKITQGNINRYAEVSGDYNPIHINEEYARNTPLGGTIAHGMMVLAYISRVMTAAFGRDWLETGHLEARFKSPSRPGDDVTAGGTVQKVVQGELSTTVECEVFCRNQNGEEVIAGEATVRLGENEDSN